MYSALEQEYQKSICARSIDLLNRLANKEGYTVTSLPEVRLLRSNRPLASTPVLYEPGIVFVCQGRKRGYLGEQIYLYDAQHYLAVSVPVPFTMETDATEDEPLLAIYITIDMKVLADLILTLDELVVPQVAEPACMLSTPLEPKLAEAVLRLLEALASPVESVVLGHAILSEIYYRVLTGPQGKTMRAALLAKGRFGKLAKAIRRIHESYHERINVDGLAAEAGMSVPSFHSHFRAVTNASPIQYLKTVRLHQARLLMLRENKSASAACMDVGYGSPSQFNREFKRLFGLTPREEVMRMRSSFAWPRASGKSTWVSSH